MRILYIFLFLSTFLITNAQCIAKQYNRTYYTSSHLYKIIIQDNELIYTWCPGKSISNPIVLAKCKISHLSDSFYKIDNSPYPFNSWWNSINIVQRYNNFCDSIYVNFNFQKCSTPIDIDILCTDMFSHTNKFNISITNLGSILLPPSVKNIYFAFHIPDKYIITLPSGYFNGYLYYFYEFDVNKKCNEIDISTELDLDSLFYQTEIKDNIIIMENDSIIWNGEVFHKKKQRI